MSESGIRNKTHITSLDYIRVLAIVSVSFNHALNRSFAISEGVYDEYQVLPLWMSVVKAFLYMFSRLGVPLFLMVSGSLLIERDYSEKATLDRFLRHNWLELFRTTEIWLAIMYWYLSLSRTSVLRTEGIERALVEFVKTLCFINQRTMGSMWYMPMILCIYLMIPIMSVSMKHLGERYVKHITAFVAVSGMLIPSVNAMLEMLGIEETLSFALTTSYLFSRYMVYVLCGYWIFKGVIRRWNNTLILILLFVSGVATAVFQFFSYTTGMDYALGYYDIGIVLTSCFLFEWMLRHCVRDNAGVRFLAKISFGIYFVHICIMEGVKALVSGYPGISHFKKFFLLETTSLGGAVILIAATMNVKIFKKYLYAIKEE